MNTYVKTILTCVMCSVFLFAHSQEFKASEFTDIPSDTISITSAISNNGGAYIDTYTPSSASHSIRLTIIFDKPLSGKSTLNFAFRLSFKPDMGDSFKVDGIHFYDVKGNRVLSPSSSIVKLNKQDSQTCYPTISEFVFGLDRDVQVNRIQLYFKTTDASFTGTSEYGVHDIVTSYSVADFMEDVVIPSPEDQENVNNSNDSMNDNKNEMDSMLNDMAAVPEPDVDDLTANLDKYLPAEHITTFSSVLSALFQNDIVIAYVMIGLVVALVSFVLFGKKG